jgi:hypothetical protein
MNSKVRSISKNFVVMNLFLLSLSSFANKSFASGDEQPKHILGGFIGTSMEERRDENFTFAIEYEYKFSPKWGLGAMVEHASGDLDFNIVALPIAYRHRHWKFSIAPGIEKSKHHGSEHLIRLGVEHTFLLDKHWEVSPKVNVDFVDGHKVLVLGLIISKAF